MTVRTDAVIASATVSAVAAGTVRPARRPRKPPVLDPPIDLATVPLAAVQAALRLAGGDASRLTFDQATGEVTVQNHPRRDDAAKRG